ncbi:hypothetical protein L596_002881 [Steinernema carpocapsae]|uniref:Uncharacterized protein n=1 Tax=Steinernema carpocapsae TaxID=34508 RepID=A0A4U8UTH8_STECR|nr:hypothetical protein L596_002881 [Steinernema carpocapsae]
MQLRSTVSKLNQKNVFVARLEELHNLVEWDPLVLFVLLETVGELTKARAENADEHRAEREHQERGDEVEHLVPRDHDHRIELHLSLVFTSVAAKKRRSENSEASFGRAVEGEYGADETNNERFRRQNC